MRALILGVACAIAASFLVASPAHADPTCDTYLLIGARGTDEAPQGSDPYTQANWDGSGILANRVFTTLEPIVAANGGTMARYGVRYAADMDLGGFATEIVNAEYNWSFDNEWDAGVAVGSDDLVNKIESMYPVCPGTKYILVGYSQGADVIGEAIDELSLTHRSRIAATALFGDPRFNPNDTAANVGNYVDHNSGMFAARPLWSTKLSSPVFSYCLWLDFACQSRQYIGEAIRSTKTDLRDRLGRECALEPDSLRFAIEGSPGNGSIEVLREFIQHGTIAFRINNGDYNVIRLAATQTEAETYYPSPG